MGKKSLAVFGLVLIALIMLISSVNASVIISQPNELYSLGDELSVQLKLDSIKTGYLDANLVCPAGSENIYHSVPDSTTINIKRVLIPMYIKNLNGNCHVSVLYTGEAIDSQVFQISNEIKITLELTQINVEAGQSFYIKGSAVKANGGAVGGANSAVVEVTINDDLKSSNSVVNGQFSVNFSTQKTMKAGAYIATVKVFDKDSDNNVLNSGEAKADISISQKPGSIEIAVDKQSVVPEEALNIIPYLYDQSGEPITQQLLLTIKDSEDNSLYEGLVNSNEQFSFTMNTSTPFGLAKISVEKDDVKQEKTIEVQKLQKVSAEIKSGQLIITNIGNTAYGRKVQIEIGDQVIVKELNLSVGESRSFEITAPDGTYTVKVKDDGSQILSQDGISLTGNAISVNEIGTRLSDFFVNYPAVWAFLLLIIVFLFYVVYKKRKEAGYSPSYDKRRAREEKKRGGVFIINKDEVSQKGVFSEFGNTKGEVISHKEVSKRINPEKINIMGDIKKAEQVLVLHGQKQKASIIAIKIKNGKPEGMAKTNLAKALEYAYDKKGATYFYGDYVLVIFTPMLTKNQKNEDTAIKVSQDIDRVLTEHNKLFKEKMNYGIGVNTGEIINRIEDNTLKFNSIDKTINLTKKIAERANQEVLLSKDIHLSTSANIRVDKNPSSGDIETFKVKRIVNTEQSKKFIDDFLRRN